MPVPLKLLLQNLKADGETLINWICEQLSSGRGRTQEGRGAVQALCILLRDDKSRVSFARHGGVGYLNKLLRMQVR